MSNPSNPSSPSNPQPQGASFIPISIVGDTDPVTQACTVTFEASLADNSEPDLSLGYYEVQRVSPNGVRMQAVSVDRTDPPVWNNGIATFTVLMNSTVFDQLSSTDTNFAVEASAGPDAWGICTFAISLSS